MRNVMLFKTSSLSGYRKFRRFFGEVLNERMHFEAFVEVQSSDLSQRVL